MILAVLLRFILCFSFPNLSDDVYRFIWDGQLIHEQINPYTVLPSQLPTQTISNQKQLFELLNSPNYYTVYPPLSQLVFYISTFVKGNLFLSALIMKLFLLACEIGSLLSMKKLLEHLNLSKNRIFIYALNPLIIIELIGNLHFEAMSVFFLLLTLLLVNHRSLGKSAMALSLGVSAKLLPLMFTPFIFKYFGKSYKFLIFLSLFLLLAFSPIWWGFQFLNFGQSLDLYFGKFEFNGSIYYVLRYLGQLLSGYNLIRFIGPAMALFLLGIMLKFYLKQKESNLLQLIHLCFFSICAYYFLSTTIHPWYLAIPLALSVFTNFRITVVWSGLIFLTYVNYSYEQYNENLWFVALEYLLVWGILFYEWVIKKGDSHIANRL